MGRMSSPPTRVTYFRSFPADRTSSSTPVSAAVTAFAAGTLHGLASHAAYASRTAG